MNLNSSVKELSIVVPVYNEAANVADVHAQILDVVSKLNKTFEIIFIDDASQDNTIAQLKQLSPVSIVCLQEHYGQSCAMDAGIKEARGEIIITLDGDGQNDPADIPLLLGKINEGYDIVCGWRHKRYDPLSKRFVAQGAALLRKIIVKDGVHDAGCTLRAYQKRCFNGIDLYGGLHRMIPAIFRWRGFKMTEIKVRHHPRLRGRSKYGWQRIIEGFCNMVYIWFWRRNPTQTIYAGRKVGYVVKNVIRISGDSLSMDPQP